MPEIVHWLFLSRFLSYIGVCAASLLVPLLVWKCTASPLIAGASLAVEWIPKLAAYLRGGLLVSKFGALKTHRAADAGRLVALALIACAWQFQIWPLAVAAAAVMQALNGVSNILFESLVGNSGARGHAKIASADMAAAIALVPLAAFLPEAALAGLAALLAGSCLAVSAWRLAPGGAYPPIPSAPEPFPLSEAYARVRSNPALPKLVAVGLLTGAPIALAFSALPALLSHAGNGWGEAGFISSFGLARAAAGILLLRAVAAWAPEKTAFAAALLIPPLWTLYGFFPQGPAALALLSALALCQTAYSPWARQRRQEELGDDRRSEMTGALIAVEAASYLLGAGLLAASLASPHGTAAVSGALLGACALIALRPLMASPPEPAPSEAPPVRELPDEA